MLTLNLNDTNGNCFGCFRSELFFVLFFARFIGLYSFFSHFYMESFSRSEATGTKCSDECPVE